MSEQTILVVDDEPEIGELLRDFLEAAGFGVRLAPHAAGAAAVLAQEPIDGMVLDVMLPGRTGFDLLREIRATSDLPVLILSAREDDADKLRGLGLGADDYIVKSATPAEVVARVQAVLRRAGRLSGSPQILDFGRLVIDATAREVRVDGEPVALTLREFDLLYLLASHPRRAFGREELFARLWGEYGDRHTVTVHVGRVREKIEADPSRPALVVTVRGLGYRFEGERV
ncbi:MAG: response regulator transcription factor [Thermomicrobiales bacterium]